MEQNLHTISNGNLKNQEGKETMESGDKDVDCPNGQGSRTYLQGGNIPNKLNSKEIKIMNQIKFTKVMLRAIKEGNAVDLAFTPTVCGDLVLAQVVSVLSANQCVAVRTPMIGIADRSYKFGNTDAFVKLCLTANIKTYKEDTMNVSTDESMTQEQWTQRMIEEATRFVAENPTDSNRAIMDTATEENILDKLQYAVQATGINTGKKEEAKGILDQLSAAIESTKTQGILDTIKSFAWMVWRKVSATMIGIGWFALRTAVILFNNTVDTGKQIGDVFYDEIITRVKNA